MRATLCVCIILTLAVLSHASSDTIQDENLVIADMRLGGIILSKGVMSYIDQERLFLPFLEFCELLEFPIKRSEKDEWVTGWFLDRGRPFKLDFINQTVHISKQKTTFSSQSVIDNGGEIYVRKSVLEKWFPVNIVYEKVTQTIQMTSRELLPIEMKLERERKRRALSQKYSVQNESLSHTHIYQSPYQLASLPFMDLRANIYPSQSKQRMNINTVMTGDLFYFTQNTILSFDPEKGLTSGRMTLSRTQPNGGIWGPMDATTVAFGDIFSNAIPLINDAHSGTGIRISNFSPSHRNDFGTITLNGSGQENWEVELYRNEMLMDFQLISAENLYSFTDIPLVSGLNTLTLKFYGPFGQTYTKTHKYLMSPEMIDPQKWLYRFSFLSQHQQIFDTNQTLSSEGQLQ
ncbi:MAG: hypothetical protein HRT90_09590, partial [Candidatus Margulisbacteria bacterium]|nr:hypothetical protein [Candidatus Margulisiibacteriota bacterium]